MQLINIQVEKSDEGKPFSVYACKKEQTFFINLKKLASFENINDAEKFAAHKKNYNYLGIYVQGQEVTKEEAEAKDGQIIESAGQAPLSPPRI